MRLFRDSAKWLFFAALIVAPWFYGGTTKESIVAINALLGIALTFWVIGLFVSRSFPLLPKVLVAISVILLLLGWWMVVNAVSIYDSEFLIFKPLQQLLRYGSGSVDYAISAAWMLRATLLIGVTWMVVDLSQDPRWLVRLWWTIGIAGGSIALLGLLQKATGAEMIFWQNAGAHEVNTFFATYYYHANAGAFLNLVWPATIGLAVRAFQKHEHPGVRALWLSLSVILIGAVAANTSRMAHLIGTGSGIAIAIMFAPRIVRQLSKAELKVVLVGTVSVLIAIFAVAQASHLDQPLQRWHRLSENLPMDARWLVSKAALGAVPDAAVFGFGPGTFRVIFPYYTAGLGAPAHGVWRFLHEDYLQTLLEWGWLGAALWAFIFFGGIVAGVRALSQYALDWTPRRRLLLRLAILALCGVALHALIDFPLQIMSIQLYVAAYVGLCWGSGRWGG